MYCITVYYGEWLHPNILAYVCFPLRHNIGHESLQFSKISGLVGEGWVL